MNAVMALFVLGLIIFGPVLIDWVTEIILF